MKILRFLLTAICFLMSSQTLFAWNNGDEFTIDGFTYYIIDVEQATVALYSTTKTGAVTIPATVFDGTDMTFTVIKIGGTDTEKVNFGGMTAVTLPNTIEYLDTRAFAGSSLTTLHLPASVKSVTATWFIGMWWEQRFGHHLPNTLKSITVDAANPYFEAADGVLYTKGKKALICYPKAKTGTTFNVPDGVEEIWGCAFSWGNTQLTTINIPASVKKISELAYSFAYADNLTAINVNSGNRYYSSIDGVLFNKAKTRLVCYPRAKNTGRSYTVPNGCTEIASHAFFSSKNTSINLNQVKTLEYRAFYDSKIASVLISNSIESIDPNSFESSKIATFSVEASSTRYSAVDGVLFSSDRKVLICYPPARANTSYTVPEGTEIIGDAGIAYNSNLQTLNIAASVDSIGVWGMRGCSNLTKIFFPTNSKLRTIGRNVFWSCTVLQEIAFPASLESINGLLGHVIPSLQKVTFAAGSRLKGLTNTFANLSSLEEVTFLGSSMLETIGSETFYNTSLKKFTIPETVKTIDLRAFADCPSLTSVTFPSDNVSKLETIGPGAFANTAFTLTRIPSSVKTIGREAFWNVKTAETINLSANIESISTEAFKGCYSLTALNVDKKNPNFSSIDGFLLSRDKKTLMICPPGKAQSSSYVLLPPSLTRIGDYAFYENSKLKSVVIPAKVTSLGKRAFGLCTALNRLVMLCDNPISGDSIAQKLNETTFDDGLTTPTDRRANITLSVRQDKLYDYFDDEFYLNFKSFTPSFDYAGGEFMELDTKKHMFVAPKNDDNTFVIPTSWGTTNPDRVVAIADYAFENASSSIKEVVGPLYLEYIGAKAFMTNPAANSSSIENVFLLNGDYQGNKFTNSTYATTRFELDETGHDYSEFAPTTKVFLKKNVFHSTAFLFSSKRYLLDVKTSLGETVRTATPQMFDYRIPFQVNSTYSTFCREFPTDFSEFNFSSRKPDLLNVIAFTAGRYLKKQWQNGEQVNVIQMTSINEGKDGDGVVIPANTGVVIKTTDGKTPEDYFYQIYEDPTFETYFNEYDEATVVRGIVKRSQTVQPTEGNLVNFILSGDRVHRMTVAREIPVHRSYLQVLRGDLQDGAATIMKFFEGDDEELLSTGLETFEQAVGNDVIYDLQGLPVRQPRKGVYIKNGKKIVVK